MLAKVVAAVYMLNFMGTGPELVPFDTMAACQAAKAEISRHWASLEMDEQLRPMRAEAYLISTYLICVKGK